MPALNDLEQGLVDEVRECFDGVDQGIHSDQRRIWTGLERLYHARRGLLRAHADAAPRERGGIVSDAREQFGHELFIPYAFSIVETVLPRLLSSRPRMLVLPRDEASERNVENMEALVNAQQEQINYELILQSVAKSGLIFGLGVQKTGWRRVEQSREMVVPASWFQQRMGNAYKTATVTERLFDDPYAEPVDIFDFFWDGYAASIDRCNWAIHRTWRNTGYVLKQFETTRWMHPEAGEITAEDLDNGGSAQWYSAAFSERLQARGLRSPSARDTDIHEVWEYHTGDRIVTILDRQWPVAMEEKKTWRGRLPFQIYRPTEVLGSFCGKGEIEAIEDLQHEMNALRTDRRWNALIKLHQPIAFMEAGISDIRKIKFGPGTLIPTNAPPSEVLFPLQSGDIPNSGYREEQALQADIERVSGISDSYSGADAGAAQTATGIQLVQASANARIQLKTRRIEVELIRQAADHWVALNQRQILEERPVRGQPLPPEPDMPERRWQWRLVSPVELAGNFECIPEGGSTAPENTPQLRQDAQMLMQMFGNDPMVDPGKIRTLSLEKSGIKNPDAYIVQQPVIPPQTLDYIAEALVQAGMNPNRARQVVGSSLSMAMDQEEMKRRDVGGGQMSGPPRGGPPDEPPPDKKREAA